MIYLCKQKYIKRLKWYKSFDAITTELIDSQYLLPLKCAYVMNHTLYSFSMFDVNNFECGVYVNETCMFSFCIVV